jgi:hypothetical protein
MQPFGFADLVIGQLFFSLLMSIIAIYKAVFATRALMAILRKSPYYQYRMARDAFDVQTRRALAERSGYRCSFPGCGALTIGPSDEAVNASSGTGMACHIAAASGGPGARRYRPDMSPEERCSIGNGIWMCYKHGRLIDTDETRFTIPMLQKWREIAEQRARFMQEHGASLPRSEFEYSGVALPVGVFQFNELGAENETIGDAIRYSCVPEVWGPDVADCIRDFAIEVARNAFQHGSASSFRMEISAKSIRLTDDGANFDIWALASSAAESGGRLSFNALLDQMSQNVIVAGRRRKSHNEIAISKIADADDLGDLTPCVAWVEWKDVREKTYQIVVDPECQLVYVVLPPYWTISDSIRLAAKIRRESHDPDRFVFVLEQASETSRALIRAAFPTSRVVSL